MGDTYLHSLINESVEQVANSQAALEAQVKAQKINQVVDKLEERYNAPETVVKDLVASFLLPEVEKEQLRRVVATDQKKFAEATRRSIEKAVVGVEQKFREQGGGEPTS